MGLNGDVLFPPVSRFPWIQGFRAQCLDSGAYGAIRWRKAILHTQRPVGSSHLLSAVQS
jgi:hypothetical protein